ncbi:hypothetical protein DFH06DRAFT_1191590 [Mycena polygramma]|nr:hypothetical protein DFH06DRAFT_1191590 [Mycena polygramma]
MQLAPGRFPWALLWLALRIPTMKRSIASVRRATALLRKAPLLHIPLLSPRLSRSRSRPSRTPSAAAPPGTSGRECGRSPCCVMLVRRRL